MLLPDRPAEAPAKQPVPTGRRERNRLARRDAIVEAAMTLFQSKGYEQTRMEEVAAEAGVSAPTLYRYFPKKPALLIALFWRGRERMAPALEAFQRKSAELDAVAAVAGLLFLNNSGVRTKAERKLWREALAALLRIHDAPDDEFRLIKQYFEKHIERMLRRLRDAGLIRRDTPLPAMVAVLYAIAAENYYRMLANEFPNVEAERRAMDAQVALVLEGWLTAR